MIRLSQAHLQNFVQCPPSFQQKYLEKLSSPNDPNQIEKQQWGVQFHLVMQQLQLGLSLDQLVTDQELKVSVEALLEKIPDFLTPKDHEFSEAEHRRTLKLENFALTVIYDWVIKRGDSLSIYDWKTYPKPEKVAYLKNHWQTKLYLYVLAETTEYSPDQLSMTYWFVKLPKEPQSLTIDYSEDFHQRVKQELSELLNGLQSSVDDYFLAHIPLQHSDQQTCRRCPTQFSKKLSQNADASKSPDILGDQSMAEFLGEIEEIQL